jgi:hypothetical protein
MCLIDVDKSNVRLVHVRRGLEGLAELFLGQLGGCQLAQFLVHQRQQLLRRRRIARFDLRQDLGDVGHGGRLSYILESPSVYCRPGQNASPRHPRIGDSHCLERMKHCIHDLPVVEIHGRVLADQAAV